MRRCRIAMQSLLSLTAALSMASCVRRYQEPALTEPHALVKFRVLHHDLFRGSQLSEALRLDGYDVAIPPGIATEPRLRTVRVRPVLSRYRFSAEYFHVVTTTRTAFRTESYSCGGYGSTARTCTRMVPYTVTDNQHVTDAACEAGMEHLPFAGGVYLVQYDFYGPDSCSVSCFRQLDGEGDAFRLIACGPDEPPVYEATHGGAVWVSPEAAEAPHQEVRATESAEEGSGRALTPPR